MSLPLDRLTIAQAVFIEANRDRLVEYGTRVRNGPYFVFRDGPEAEVDEFIDLARKSGFTWVSMGFVKNTSHDYFKFHGDIVLIPNP